MIFVTVGTHEQSFNRLLKEVDRLKAEKIINEEVFMQIGFTDFVPQHTQWEHTISFNKMEKLIEESRIVITHGGAATYLSVLKKGKRPIVVPRLYEFQEHVNNHQIDFAKKVQKTGIPIIVIEDIKDLKNSIIEYRNLDNNYKSHTQQFVSDFSVLARSLVNKGEG